MKTLTLVALLCLFSFLCPAQDYWVAAGAGFNHYLTPQASGWITLGKKITENNYGFTTVSMTSVAASMRFGLSRILAQKDGFVLQALADGGVVSGLGEVGPAFSGGGALSYEISKWTKIPGSYITTNVLLFKSTLNELQPQLSIGIGKTF